MHKVEYNYNSTAVIVPEKHLIRYKQLPRKMTIKEINKNNVCMFAYRPIPKFMNRLKVAQSVNLNGYNVDFICPKDYNETDNETLSNVNIYRTKDQLGSWKGYSDRLLKYLSFTYNTCLKIKELNKSKHYYYYHIHTPPDFLIISVIPYKLIYGSKIILDLHDMLPETVESNLKGLKKSIFLLLAIFIEKISVYLSDAIICTNLYDKEIVISRNNINPDKIYVVMNVPNPNQTGLIYAEKKDFNLEDKFVVLFEGTVWERRGIQTVVEAVELLQNQLPALFVIVGDGPYLNQLKEIVEKKDISTHVKFTGWVNQNDLSRYISISDIGVIPFLRTKVNERGVPNKLFEYIIHDKPVCASNLKGMNSTFSKEEIMFFEPGNAKDLAAKIEWCYNNPDLVSEMKTKAKKRYLQEYTWDQMEKELRRCYNNI